MILSRNILIYLSTIYAGEWTPIYEHISARGDVDLKEVSEKIPAEGISCLTFLDENYPSSFYESYRPPFVLYYEGDLSLLNSDKRIVSIGGSLDIDEATTKAIKEIVEEVCENENVVILSSLARGSQITASRVAIEKGKCILMLASGMDRPMNATESELIRLAKKKGLVITQYPLGTEATPSRARSRNQLIAQAGDFLLVCSSRAHEPVYEMVAFALHKGREVGCLPYRAREGNHNNFFLKDGACLVTNGEDILFDLGLSNQPFPNE